MKNSLILCFLILFMLPANSEVLQGGIIHENGKIITPFYFNGQINSFGVQYEDDLYHNFYYDLNGKLIQYDVIDKPRTEFPHITISYDKNGNIISISKSISKTEQFVYDSSGNLKAKWIRNNCFDAKGNKLSSKRVLN